VAQKYKIIPDYKSAKLGKYYKIGDERK